MDTELSLWIKPVILGLFSPVTHFPLGGEGSRGETAFADVWSCFPGFSWWRGGTREPSADGGWAVGEGSEDTPRVTGPGELLSLSLWSTGLRVEQLWRVERMK